MSSDLAAFAGLFVAAFLAATPLPGSSEVVLVGLMSTERHAVWSLVAVATIANTLGSVFNWCCGRLVERYSGRRWFPATPEQLARGRAFFERFGKWSLLFAWFPIGGDALTVIAGVLRVPLLQFVVLVGVGKLMRYTGVALAAHGLLGG